MRATKDIPKEGKTEKNIVTRQIRLPFKLAEQLRNVAGYGNVEELMIKLLQEGVAPRYQKWLSDQLAEQVGEKKAVKSAMR